MERARLHCDTDLDGDDSDECGGPDVNDHPSVFVWSDNRYTVMHEFGHTIMHLRNETLGSSNNPDPGGTIHEGCFYDDQDPLTSDNLHEFQQKEMLAEAFHEGFANFYAAAIFNRQDEVDCAFQYFAMQDFDLDGDDDPDYTNPHPRDLQYNCEAKPDELLDGGVLEAADPIQASVDAYDYLHDSNVGLGCGTQLTNRATEYDFLRFWWDLTTNPSNHWSLVDVLNILDRANPQSWIGDLNDTDPNGAGNPPDLPTMTLQATLLDAVADSVITETMRQEWIAVSAYNGTDR